MNQSVPLESATSEGEDVGFTGRPKPDSGSVDLVQNERLVRLPTVLQTVQTGRTMWLDMVKAGKAPQPIRIGRATFWQASALQSWIADRVRESRGGR